MGGRYVCFQNLKDFFFSSFQELSLNLQSVEFLCIYSRWFLCYPHVNWCTSFVYTCVYMSSQWTNKHLMNLNIPNVQPSNFNTKTSSFNGPYRLTIIITPTFFFKSIVHTNQIKNSIFNLSKAIIFKG